MDGHERPHKKARPSSLTASIGDLLSSGKYSDLEIRCDGKSFKVHRNIVCGRSNVMDRECDGGFIEAQIRVIKHNMFDSFAMDRMLQFMYRNDYILSLVCPAGKDPDFSTTETENTESMRNEVQRSVDWTEEDVLTAHVHVYAIADYYELVPLQKLAVKNFESLARRWQDIPAEALANVASIVYESTTAEATALRHQLFSLIWENPMSSVDNIIFMDALGSRPQLQELAAHIITESILRHRACENTLQKSVENFMNANNTLQMIVKDLQNARDTIQRELDQSIADMEALSAFKDDQHGDILRRCNFLQENVSKLQNEAREQLAAAKKDKAEYQILQEQVADLHHFTRIKQCGSCKSDNFSYTIQYRSGKGYTAYCVLCNFRHVRPSAVS